MSTGEQEAPGRAEALLAELDAQRPERRILLCNSRRFADDRLVHLLLDAAEPARGASPRTMVERATLAERISRHLDRPNTRARACGLLGNASRIASDHGIAEAWLRQAISCLDGCTDETLRPRVLRYLATLRVEQRRFEDCHHLMAEIFCMWRQLDRPQEMAASLVVEATARVEGGEPVKGLSTLLKASELVDPSADPLLNLFLVHNFARCLLDAGEPRMALEHLAAGEPLYATAGTEDLRTKGTWLKGQIISALGYPDAALPLFIHAQTAFAERGQIYEHMGVSLDLAVVLGRIGHPSQAKAVAAQTLALARKAGAMTEAAAASSLLAHTN